MAQFPYNFRNSTLVNQLEKELLFFPIGTFDFAFTCTATNSCTRVVMKLVALCLSVSVSIPSQVNFLLFCHTTVALFSSLFRAQNHFYNKKSANDSWIQNIKKEHQENTHILISSVLFFNLHRILNEDDDGSIFYFYIFLYISNTFIINSFVPRSFASYTTHTTHREEIK